MRRLLYRLRIVRMYIGGHWYKVYVKPFLATNAHTYWTQSPPSQFDIHYEYVIKEEIYS